MGFMDGVRDLFPHTVSIAPYTGQNEAGEAIYGNEEVYQAKVERGVDLARTGAMQSHGRSIVPTYKVFIAEPVQVDIRDALILDVTFGMRDQNGIFQAPDVTIVMVTPIYDEQEWVCTIIYCG